MIMKDKLVKNHHKGVYYAMRRFVIVLLGSFTIFASIAIPTYISVNQKRNRNAGLAVEDTNSESEEQTDDSNSGEDIYEEYVDE